MITKIIDTRIRSVKRQIRTLTDFATTPAGIFETIDEVIKNFRRANQETLKSLTYGDFGKIIKKLGGGL